MVERNQLVALKQRMLAGAYDEALSICRDVLSHTPDSFEANVFAGKACYMQSAWAEAEAYYQTACRARPGAPQPYQGLIELYAHIKDHANLAAAISAVIPTVTDPGKLLDLKMQRAAALVAAGDHEGARPLLDELRREPRSPAEAATVLQLCADCQVAGDRRAMEMCRARAVAAHAGQNLPEDELLHAASKAIARWADEQLHVPAAEDAVRQVCETTRPSPRWAPYHEAQLNRCIAAIDAGDPGSMDRHERRVLALRLCLKLIGGSGIGPEGVGGCCTVLPFETALRLLEIEEVVSAAAHAPHAAPAHAATPPERPSDHVVNHDTSPVGSSLTKQPSFPASKVRRSMSQISGMPPANALQTSSMSNLDRLAAGMSLVRRSEPGSAQASVQGGSVVHAPSGDLPGYSPRSSLSKDPPSNAGVAIPSATPTAAPVRSGPWGSAASATPFGGASPRRTSVHASLSSMFEAPTESERPSVQLVRIASRVSRSGACEENIPICGSFELRALSRTFDDDAAATPPMAPATPPPSKPSPDGNVNISYPADVAVPWGSRTPSSPPAPLSPQGSVESDIFGAQMSESVMSVDTNVSYRTVLPSLTSMQRMNQDGTVTAPDPVWGTGPDADPLGSEYGGFRVGSIGSQLGGLSAAPSMAPSHYRASSIWPGNEDHLLTAQRVGLVEDMERVACRLVHSFPWSAAGQVHTALALARREGMLEGHTKQKQRGRIVATLERALERGVATAAGWLMLAEMYLKDGQAAAALRAAKAGLKYVNERQKKYHMEPMVQAGLALRLEAAWALLALGLVDEAKEAFSLLKDWTSEGDVTFAAMAGVVPASVRQQAYRGLAKVELARGNQAGAKFQYEKVLGRSLRGYGPSEHWAHAEYGWILFNEGDLASARHHLTMAIDIANMTDVPASERASHQYHLGRIYWALKRKYREDQEFAYAQFLEAASIEGPDQADAFAWLGHWFRDVQNEDLKARKCYRRSLYLNPRQAEAGFALCDLLHLSNSESLVEELCHEVLAMYDSAAWARQRLGMHYLWSNRAAEAITELQLALRVEPNSAVAWEALGAAYERMGRLNASLKAYQRVVELDPSRLYALTQAAAIMSVMGDTDQALAMLDKARGVNPTHPAVLLGIYQTYTQLSNLHASIGAITLAARDLARAEEAAALATRKHGTLEAAWKALGDCLFRQAAFPVLSQPLVADLVLLTSPAPEMASALEAAYVARFGRVRAARRAYATLIHLNPLRSAAWSDMALTHHQEGVLMATLPSAQDPARAQHCSKLAERVMLGALNLTPDVCGLWTALGSVDLGPAKREYALRRALQIDPTDALAWLKLGRLYQSLGCHDSVKECYDNARSQDPRMAAIWEAMGASSVGVASTPPPAALQEATECYKHALLHALGAGPEAALGYAYGALRQPAFPEALALSAMHRLQPVAPLNVVVYHTLALTLEQAGSPAAAANMLGVAAELVQRGRAAAQPSTSYEPALVPFERDGVAEELHVSIAVDLARNLCKAGDAAGALRRYEALAASGAIATDPHALCGHAAALLATGRSADAAAAMWQAVSVATTAADAAAMSLRLVRLSAAVDGAAAATAAAAQLAPALEHFCAPAASVAAVWLAALASAAAARDAAELSTCLAELAPLVYRRTWDDDASATQQSAAEAAADVLLATGALAKSALGMLRRTLAAVHVCPWSAQHRAVAASTVAGGVGVQRATVEAARRLMPTAVPAHASADVGGALHVLGDRDAQDAAALLAGSVACTSEHTARTVDGRLRALLLDAIHDTRRRVHADPHALRPRYLLSMLLTQRAVIDGDAAAARGASKLAALTLDRLQRRPPDAGAAAMTTQLLVAQSVALLVAGDAAEATARAQAALESEHPASTPGLAYRQLARCHAAAGNVGGAEAALQHAAAVGDAPAVLLLVDLLTRAGRAAEGVALLERSLDAAPSDAQTPLRDALPPPAAEFGDALRVKRVALLCTLGDLERAKAAFGSHAMDASHRALAQVLLGGACVAAAKAAATNGAGKDAPHLLAESRRLLRAGAAVSSRRDQLLASCLVAAEGDAARGRDQDAAAALRRAEGVASGVEAARVSVRPRSELDAAAVGFVPWTSHGC